MHSLHNPHLIRSVLPRELVAPVPYFQRRDEAHTRLAKTLRSNQAEKKKAANARKAAKKAMGGGTRAASPGQEHDGAEADAALDRSAMGMENSGFGDVDMDGIHEGTQRLLAKEPDASEQLAARRSRKRPRLVAE